jgi:hypothetical protein
VLGIEHWSNRVVVHFNRKKIDPITQSEKTKTQKKEENHIFGWFPHFYFIAMHCLNDIFKLVLLCSY